MMQLLEAFGQAGYALHFGTSAEKTEQSVDLKSMGAQIHALPLNDKLASDTIKELHPDVVIFDRFMTEEQFGWRVEEEAPGALRILNTEDLHSLRKARQLAMEADMDCDLDYWLRHDVTLRELSSILRCDLNLMISKTECEWLAKTGFIPAEQVLYLPFMLDSINIINTDSYKPYSERESFCFIGYGRHVPNADAVRFTIESIWPLIRQELPEAKLEIYGKDYPTDIQGLHDPSNGIFIQGWIDEVSAAFTNARVNLAPLRYGAGLKGKIIDATRHGIPSIMTSIAAEGLFLTQEYEALIADDPNAFANKAISMYRDESLWQLSIETMQARLSDEMDRKKHHQRLHQHVDGLLEGLEAHRGALVLSRILRHQRNQSSRYMAKWIEAKNRP